MSIAGFNSPCAEIIWGHSRREEAGLSRNFFGGRRARREGGAAFRFLVQVGAGEFF